ncbi:hypothetical protein [Candidatus Kuenenia stuttgartiensis]|uniref:hypothetical protein n=1 Tax=Kuenenia stuttgartiensis TaxID=174633 RepID=UPI00146BD831|nr:hypothetical protein [Candidatus Kuenenia stuttgartiensis]
MITAVLFSYLALERVAISKDIPEYLERNENNALTYLAFSGFLLGLGIGVRVTYLALAPVMLYVAFLLRNIFSVEGLSHGAALVCCRGLVMAGLSDNTFYPWQVL